MAEKLQLDANKSPVSPEEHRLAVLWGDMEHQRANILFGKLQKAIGIQREITTRVTSMAIDGWCTMDELEEQGIHDDPVWQGKYSAAHEKYTLGERMYEVLCPGESIKPHLDEGLRVYKEAKRSQSPSLLDNPWE